MGRMTNSFEIGGIPVGGDAPVFIVAELSANHAGQRDVALKTIEAAKKVGADAIKLQTYTPDTLTLKSDAEHFVVRTKNEWAGRTLHDLYAEAMTPWEWHAELKQCAESLGLVLFSTPFDPTATEYLEALDVPAHKIASFEIVDLPLVEHVARRGKPMIISTGMASLGDIEAAVATCRAVGNDRIALLRCVSCYPARPDVMNLESFRALAAFGTVLGLSDHTRDASVAIASVALGAKLIEKHFILDRSMGGPDAFFSLEPADFAAMVEAVRATERALGAPRFGVSEDERASATFRRSLFVARDVGAGSILTCDDVRSVRPAHGLSPVHLPAVLGRRAARDLTLGMPLSWELVGPAPEAPPLTLARATLDDRDALLAWRNDEETRRASVSQGEVSREQHAAWMDRTLASSEHALFVARDEAGARVGQGRIDLAPAAGAGAWEVSITVAPEARGRRLSTPLLRALEEVARERGARLLVARIDASNTKSIATFKRAGYYAFVDRVEAGRAFVFCERRITPFGMPPADKAVPYSAKET